MVIENRNLEVGTRLVASYKKTQYVCVVEKATPDACPEGHRADDPRFEGIIGQPAGMAKEGED